ncbi:metallophosphoesterase [Chitinophaga sp. 212800010-3]|uniref:metallophosphoesterase family protein n=1 Tax=unclassified Chitinophaga TaxID=2619133 RepID=UPI002DEDFC18|nr:hypothetical protein [Chitinophaga sp. 212800010-3]
MKRRELIRALGISSLFPLSSIAGIGNATPAGNRRLRIAHLTDIHLKDDFNAPGHFAKCLQHVQHLTPSVDLILNGGDIVFDANKENVSSITQQWNLYHAIIKKECSIPVYHVLGNHDVWWNEDDRNQTLYGKKLAMDQLHLDRPYYSFVKNGWKFICLDSVHLDIDNTWYIGKLGEAQFDWLKEELNSTNPATPICILSHIPILTATNLIADDVVNRWEMLGGDMHTDVAKIIHLFYQHPNVKLCLGGHIHLLDKVVYNNVTYICDGAVSGAWWKGNNRETAPGYGLIDLYANGDFHASYVNY